MVGLEGLQPTTLQAAKGALRSLKIVPDDFLEPSTCRL
jgi:hypothetical protein